MSATPGTNYTDKPATLWAGMLIAPTATLLQLAINYALVLWACQSGQTWPLHLTGILALALTVGSGWISFQKWLQTVGAWEDGMGVIPRSHFMAMVGMLSSALFALIGIALWIPIFMYGPCQR